MRRLGLLTAVSPLSWSIVISHAVPSTSGMELLTGSWDSASRPSGALDTHTHTCSSVACCFSTTVLVLQTSSSFNLHQDCFNPLARAFCLGPKLVLHPAKSTTSNTPGGGGAVDCWPEDAGVLMFLTEFLLCTTLMVQFIFFVKATVRDSNVQPFLHFSQCARCTIPPQT